MKITVEQTKKTVIVHANDATVHVPKGDEFQNFINALEFVYVANDVKDSELARLINKLSDIELEGEK